MIKQLGISTQRKITVMGHAAKWTHRYRQGECSWDDADTIHSTTEKEIENIYLHMLSILTLTLPHCLIRALLGDYGMNMIHTLCLLDQSWRNTQCAVCCLVSCVLTHNMVTFTVLWIKKEVQQEKNWELASYTKED